MDEGGSVEVCVEIEGSDIVIDSQLALALGISIVGGTATGKEYDYTASLLSLIINFSAHLLSFNV